MEAIVISCGFSVIQQFIELMTVFSDQNAVVVNFLTNHFQASDPKHVIYGIYVHLFYLSSVLRVFTASPLSTVAF